MRNGKPNMHMRTPGEQTSASTTTAHVPTIGADEVLGPGSTSPVLWMAKPLPSKT